MKTKHCNRCQRILPVELFGPDKQTKDGFRYYCKECRADRNKYYIKQWKHKRKTMPKPIEKICSMCKTLKPITEFIKDACRPDGHHVWCKDCRHSKTRIYRINYAINHPDRIQKQNRKTVYNHHQITHKVYEELVISQNGLCAICGNPPTMHYHNGKYLHIDHEHKTGKIRGLLCSKCNHGIGSFNDDPLILEKAIIYLRYFL